MSEPHVVIRTRDLEPGEVCPMTARFIKEYELVGVVAKGKIGVRPKDNVDGIKGRVARLCEASPSRWSLRARVYVMDTLPAKVVQLAVARGWDATPDRPWKRAEYLDPQRICHSYAMAKKILLR